LSLQSVASQLPTISYQYFDVIQPLREKCVGSDSGGIHDIRIISSNGCIGGLMFVLPTAFQCGGW
jgi:hypothetical protein